ncbi:MAG: WXG100 family type VII secretion target [Oscillospiraceae bacterium]|nr:WXG100 family type VII secretion target [Oscillospiraceae bacterium]
MSNLVIKVSTEEINNKASQIEKEKNEMEAIMSDMKSKVTALADFWKSRSGTNYVDKYQNVTREITASLDNISNHIQDLRTSAELYREGDSNSTSTVDRLPTTKMFNN